MFNLILKAFNRKKIDSIKKYALARGVPKSTLDESTVMHLMRYPEATVITILDSFNSLLSKGLNEWEAISRIEKARLNVDSDLAVPKIGISDYVIYRIMVEHTSNKKLSSSEVEHLKNIIADYLNK